MATNKFTYKTYQAPTLFDGLQNASKEELSYLIALLRQQTMKNIFSDKFNNTVTTGKKAFNSVMSFFGKTNKTNDDIDRESKENHQDINNKIKEEIRALQSYSQEQLYTLFIDDYCSYLGWAANTISHYEIEKVNYPKEEHPFIKWYYPQFAIGLGEVPEKIDSIFNNEIQNILNDANTLISEDNFEQYQAEVYDSIIEGFKKAIENIDKKKTNNVIFFVSIVDSDNAEIMENYSAEQLNSYDKFLTFKNRFQSKP